jgi:hypothetical protein
MKLRVMGVAGTLAILVAFSARADLAGLWLFDGSSGDVAVDSSGNGNDGVINNGNRVGGKIGGAVELNGTDANVEIPHSASLSVNEFTLMAWVDSPAFTGGWQTIATQHTDGPTRNYGLFINDSSGLVHYSFTSGNGWNSFNATSDVVGGGWRHVAATYDGAMFTCYVDGAVDGETPVALVPDTAESVVTLGSWVGGGWLAGKLDEVALYDSALSASEIAAAMQGVMQGVTPVESKGKLAVTWGALRTR